MLFSFHHWSKMNSCCALFSDDCDCGYTIVNIGLPKASGQSEFLSKGVFLFHLTQDAEQAARLEFYQDWASRWIILTTYVNSMVSLPSRTLLKTPTS